MVIKSAYHQFTKIIKIHYINCEIQIVCRLSIDKIKRVNQQIDTHLMSLLIKIHCIFYE